MPQCNATRHICNRYDAILKFAESVRSPRTNACVRSDRVDPDMLDERARFQLDYANPRDLIRINKPN